MSVCIVDYHMGNLRSVKKALDRVGVVSVVSSDVDTLHQCDKIILPGVGHFARGISNLQTMGLFDAIMTSVLLHQKPILGICLGMQLLTLKSEEGGSAGFGFIPTSTVRFPAFEKGGKYRVPHIGWNTVDFDKSNPLFKGISAYDPFYFVHSYYIKPCDEPIIQDTTDYGISFVSAVASGCVYGTQFHPEKSYDAGLQLLENFCAI